MVENGRKFNIKTIKSDGDCKHERKWIKQKNGNITWKKLSVLKLEFIVVISSSNWKKLVIYNI